MASSSLWVVLLSISMFLGSFLAGNIPLALQFSEEKLALLSTFGSGLLVGTAFIVILPEGVETLFAVQDAALVVDDIAHLPKAVVAEDDHYHESADNIQHNARSGQRLRRGPEHPQQDSDHNHLEDLVAEIPEFSPTTPSHALKKATPENHHDHDHPDHAFEAAGYIGPALTLGFLFMLLIDQCGPSHAHDHSHHHVSVADLKDGLPPPSTSNGSGNGSQKRMAATIGLVVHAAADGIAMGAASASDQSSLELIVFMAIMLHKAPSAFGLTTHLLHEGNNRRTIRQHLMAFSLAAPISALVTYILLSQTGWDDPIGMRKWTGLLLLFSAGTFIYVATMHILPEIILNGPIPTREPLGSSASHTSNLKSKGEGRLTWTQLSALVVGMFVPYLLMVKHSH
ncbi:Zinc/iron permease [Chytridium lagenaria]|nr:Zinc/iron permease [Chytridium lagenaria]